jgi:hypothetical protein
MLGNVLQDHNEAECSTEYRTYLMGVLSGERSCLIAIALDRA